MKKKLLRLFRTSSFMLRYIVSHLRERALVSGCQYISATIFDGLNNLKREKVLFGGRKKGKAQKKGHPGPKSFCQELENLRINCEGLMGKEDGEKTTNRTNLHEWLKKGTQRALMTQIWVSE